MILQEICPAWCKRALLWTSVSTAGHVANSRGASLKSSSASDIRFLSNALKAKKDALKVDQKVSQFYFRVFLRASVLLWNEPQNKLPPETKRFAWVFSGFQTRCDRCRFWTETVRVGARTGWEGARGGYGLDVCGCWAGAGKISQVPGGAGLI